VSAATRVRARHERRRTSSRYKGQDLEKIVLARAVYAHLQHQILVYHNRTVVFE
jgi:formyltetrahydrofolate deformylase